MLFVALVGFNTPKIRNLSARQCLRTAYLSGYKYIMRFAGKTEYFTVFIK
jgi:hypothetical protein